MAFGDDITSDRSPSPIFQPTKDNPAGKEIVRNGRLEIVRNGCLHDVQKIHRIRLNRTANVEILRVESPSEIWVRLRNHIAHKLTVGVGADIQSDFVHFPHELKQLDSADFKPGFYVLAPRDNRCYARARILKIHKPTAFRRGARSEEALFMGELAQVFFIDSAERKWVAKDALAKLFDDWFYHPWQAIGVCMAGVQPRKKPGQKSDNPLWSATVCERLRDMLPSVVDEVDFQHDEDLDELNERFAQQKLEGVDGEEDDDGGKPRPLVVQKPRLNYQLRVLFSSKPTNDYKQLARVELFELIPAFEDLCVAHYAGMEMTDKENHHHNVAGRLQSVCITEVKKTVALDASAQPQFGKELEQADRERDRAPDSQLKLALYARSWPEDWMGEAHRKKAIEDRLSGGLDAAEKYDARKHLVPVLDLATLEKEGCCLPDGRLVVHVEARHTYSPSDFFARPVDVRELKRAQAEMEGPGRSIEPRKLVQLHSAAMRDAFEKHTKWHDQLASFYANSDRRRPIDRHIVNEWLEEGLRVYAIAALDAAGGEDGGRSAVFWTRVEILALCDTWALLRAIDAGGFHNIILTTPIQNSAGGERAARGARGGDAPTELFSSGGSTNISTYQLCCIHPEHCKYPPLGIQLTVDGLLPKSTRPASVAHQDREESERRLHHECQLLEWPSEARRAFTTGLRSDVLISVTPTRDVNRSEEPLRRRGAGPNEDDVRLNQNLRCKLHGVLNVKDIKALRSIQDPGSLDQALVDKGLAIWA